MSGCVTHSDTSRTRVSRARPICTFSESRFFFETGCNRHWAAGRARNRRICQITNRLRNAPISATSIIGIRIRSWCRPLGAASVPAADANAPRPISTRTLLIAMSAGHAACSSAKRKVEKPTTRQRSLTAGATRSVGGSSSTLSFQIHASPSKSPSGPSSPVFAPCSWRHKWILPW